MVHTEKWIPAPGDRRGEKWRRWKDIKNRNDAHRKAKKRAELEKQRHPGPDAGKKQRTARPAVQTTAKETTHVGKQAVPAAGSDGERTARPAVQTTAKETTHVGKQAVPAAGSDGERTAPVDTVPAVPAIGSHDDKANMRTLGEYLAKASGLDRPQDPDVKVITSCTCGPDVRFRRSCSFCMYQISHEILRHVPFELPTPPGAVDGDLILSVSKRALQEYVADSCLKYWNGRMRREQQHHQGGSSQR